MKQLMCQTLGFWISVCSSFFSEVYHDPFISSVREYESDKLFSDVKKLLLLFYFVAYLKLSPVKEPMKFDHQKY